MLIKRRVLEINGREVAIYSEECLYVASSINVPDKNSCGSELVSPIRISVLAILAHAPAILSVS